MTPWRDMCESTSHMKPIKSNRDKLTNTHTHIVAICIVLYSAYREFSRNSLTSLSDIILKAWKNSLNAIRLSFFFFSLGRIALSSLNLNVGKRDCGKVWHFINEKKNFSRSKFNDPCVVLLRNLIWRHFHSIHWRFILSFFFFHFNSSPDTATDFFFTSLLASAKDAESK